MKALLGTLLIAHRLVHIPLPLAPGADGKVGTWLGLFWHPWLVVGLALDLAFLLAVMLKWTPAAK